MSDPAGTILLATSDTVLFLDPEGDRLRPTEGLDDVNPTCLAGAAGSDGPVWCGTTDAGVYRSDDGGRSWRPAGLEEAHVTALTVDPVQTGVIWAGTEPSAAWRGRWTSNERGASTAGTDARGGGGDGESEPGVQWERREGLLDLPSSDHWSFPPRPETHHVRWIECHPRELGRLWAAIEAGALVWTTAGGTTWSDRVEGSPHDTHEIAIHPDRPDLLRVAAGDGYFESPDAGASWRSPMEGLEVGYLRSVAVKPHDPDAVLVSAASTARSAYASSSFRRPPYPAKFRHAGRGRSSGS